MQKFTFFPPRNFLAQTFTSFFAEREEQTVEMCINFDSKERHPANMSFPFYLGKIAYFCHYKTPRMGDLSLVSKAARGNTQESKKLLDPDA